jgi:hypothetical protein
MRIIERFAFLLFSMPILIFPSGARAQSTEAPSPDFAVGQEWSIKSASPTTAKVVIGRVEDWRDKVVVQVSIIDIPIPAGLPSAGGVTRIDHVPFDKAALAASVDQLLATGVSPAPDFEAGYQQWKDAKGGIFTISVPEVVTVMFESVNRGRV